MSLLIRAAILAAAGVAGWALAKRKSGQPAPDGEKRVVYLSDEDAVIDVERPPVSAAVKNSFRRMDPLSLRSANEAVFILDDGTELRLNFTGEGGLHLLPGDRGMLTWRGMQLIRFEKETGDVIGGAFYSPAEEAPDD